MQCFQSSDLSTPSREVPGAASRLKHFPKLVSVNVGGLTAFKCSYVQQLTRKTEILMLQELHKQGMQRLQRMVNVSSASGRWFFSKLPEKATGVATFLCNELASQVTDTDGRSDRILKLVVKLGGKRSLVLVNTYAPHCGHGQETYKMYLKELKSKLNGVNKRRLVLICGDFNAQVSRKELNVEGKLGLSHHTNANGKLLVEFLKEKELTLFNHLVVTGKKGSRKHATFMPRSNSGGPSEIDYVITNNIPAITGFKISPTISYNLWMKRNLDHLAISVRINVSQGRKTSKRARFQLDYSVLGSYTSIQEKVNREVKEALDLNDTLTDTYLTLTHSIPAIMKKHLPEVKYNLPEHQSSEQTMSLMRYKRANLNNLNSEEKKRITNDLRSSAKEDYSNWLDRIAAEIETAFQSKSARTGYQLIKKVKPVRKQFGKITKNTAGKLVGTAGRIQILKEYSEKQQNLQLPTNLLTENQIRHYQTPIFAPAPSNNINIHPPKADEIKECIKTLKNNKAPGPDNLRNEVLKHVEIVQKHAVREIQSFFRLDVFKSRKMRKICRGKVVYLYKQKGSKNDPSNYRPISLLNSHFKLLTRIINNRITPILNKLPNYQEEFRNNRSTIQKIEELDTIIKETLKQKIYLRILFIDFAKAFDSISHKFMKLALEEHHVPKKLIKLITTFYDKTRVFVSDSGEKSSLVNIKRGVLQGDSLSPSIFILCLDSIMKRIKDNTLQGTSLHNQIFRYFAFADDLVILTRNDEEIISFVTQLQNLQQLTGPKINISKTKVMLTNEGYNLVDKIPGVDINKILTNFHCEHCDRYFYRETSLKFHKNSRVCNGTRNRNRAGTLAVTDSRTIIHDKIQPRTNNVEVAGEKIQAVIKYKYLGPIFDPQGIDADAISKKLNEAHNHTNRFRDILSSSNIQKKTRINLAKALVVAPAIYNVENWPSNEKITKALTKKPRRLKRTIDGIDSFDFQLEEDDLDLTNIVEERQETHKSTARDIVDKELTALREYQLQNPSPPSTAKPIYYYEALALLGEEPVPPEDPPPSHFTHLPENENQPSNCTRSQEPEEHLNRNQHLNRNLDTNRNTDLDLSRNTNLDLNMSRNLDTNRTPTTPILRPRYNTHNQPTENTATRISPKALSEMSRITAGGRGMNPMDYIQLLEQINEILPS
eukprot:augustus_masked-scaffold_1-processed-gene-31.66-mRNA-1 protein AED:1.00 eAED:1.00 QI:0/-1/0/0/-1/1/1/0/1165